MKKLKMSKMKDKKVRGEWAEMKFMTCAAEHGLCVSKPWGDSNSYDFVVGRPVHFVAVQVKCTVFNTANGVGYICSTCSSHKQYRRGAFDFAAAYLVCEDVWYIIPEKEIRGLKSISLCTVGGEAKYEEYREAWGLLRKVAETGETGSSAEQVSTGESTVVHPASALGRMEAAGNFFRRYMERSNLIPQKEDENS